MKYINLNKGKRTIVDVDDYEYLSQRKWYVDKNNYVYRQQYIGRDKEGKIKFKRIQMHRLINRTPENMITDHINRDRLDNRKSNLRSVTYSQNGFNKSFSKRNKSGYMGVYFDKVSEKWEASITCNNRKITLGRSRDINIAIEMRRNAEKLYFGEIA